MYKIAVIGDYDSIYGFAALGLDTFPVTTHEEAGERLHVLAAKELKHEIARYQGQLLPAIIQIPGISGNTGDGVRGVKKSVEQAVGSDILFSN